MDTVMHLRKVQIMVNGKEESGVVVLWVTDGVDWCCVGFLQKHLVKKWRQFEDKLYQVTDMLAYSESSTKRRLSYRNHGACIVTPIEEPQPIEFFTQPDTPSPIKQPVQKKSKTDA